jgi:chromosome segregation protein
LQFTRLRVSGFKSFSDPADLLIEDGLTGIVGPNGCGKSNIVEALRWVMGESSARGLRGTEMDDVIFAGSAFRAPFDLAEVVLRLRGPVPGLSGLGDEEEIEVGRRIGRGAGSAYRINGREARARDIQILFADAAAGHRSAAVVGQGQIGFIVDARPEERRRLLEEAAGIGGLHGRRREAEIKLEHTLANLSRVVDLLARQEEQLSGLRKQAREAERYKRIAGDLRAAEALLLKRRHDLALAAAAAAAAGVTAAEQVCAATGTRMAEARQVRQRLAHDVEQARAEQAAVATEVARLEERAAAEAVAARHRAAERDAVTRRAAETSQEIARETRRKADLEARRDADAGECHALTIERARLAAALEAAVPAEALAAEAAGGLERALAAEDRAEAEVAARAAAAAAQLLQLVERREAARRSLAAATGTADEPAHTAAIGEHERSRAALRDLEERRAALEHDLAALQECLEERRSALGRLETARQDATERLHREQARLKEQEAGLRELTGRRDLVERGIERVAARERALAQMTQDLSSRQAALDLPARMACLERAGLARDAAALAAEEAEGGKAGAEAEAAAAADRERGARSELERLVAERAALAALTPALEGEPLADRLAIAPTHAAALAAALGDDLLVSCTGDGAARWLETGDDGAGEPPLPEGIDTLALHVSGPSLITRRLRQIGVVDAADGPRLQRALHPGQRLVTLDGRLWRWDGLVRSEAADAAVRHRQRQRLVELRRMEADAETAVAGLARDREAVEVRLARSVAEAGAAAEAARRAESALAEARHAAERAESEAAALAGQSRRLEAEGLALAQERGELAGELQALAGQMAGLPDADQLRADLAAARQSLEAVEREAGDAARGLDETAALARARGGELASVARAVDETRRRVEAGREAIEAAVREVVRREAAVAAARARHEAEIAEIEPALAAADTARAGLEAERAQAQGRRDATMAQSEAARRRRQETQERRIALESEKVRVEERLAAATRSSAALVEQIEEASARLEEAQARAVVLAAQLEGLPAEADRPEQEALERELGTSGSRREAVERRLEALQTDLLAAERAAADAEERAMAGREALALAQAEAARAEAARVAAVEAVAERLGRPVEAALAGIAAEAAETLDPLALETRVDKLRLARERLGAVNLRAAQEVLEAEQALGEARAEEAELRQAIERLKRAISTLNGEARERLRRAFDTVEVHFRRLFVELFGGGRAHLRLTNLEDPLGAGLELDAMPPGKRLSHISLLSGGEKSLTALALMFAFFLAKPAPLCVLDEVDAPLDDANVDRFVGLMAGIARDTGTRFLVVTHHPLTMARMDRLYGVTMVERGVSRLVSVALGEAVEMRATA